MFEPRYTANLPLTVTGIDAKGHPFRQGTTIINISRRGARISGLPSLTSAGDVIKVAYGGKQADFLIVWIKRDSGVAGLCCLERDNEFWGTKISEAATAVRLTGRAAAPPPQSPARHPVSHQPAAPKAAPAQRHVAPPAPPLVHSFYGGSVPTSILQVERTTARNNNPPPPEAEPAASAAAGPVPDLEVVPEAPSPAESPKPQSHTSGSSSFYGSAVPRSLLEPLGSGTSLVTADGEGIVLAKSAGPVASLRSAPAGICAEPDPPPSVPPRPTFGDAMRLQSSCATPLPTPRLHPRVSNVRQRRYPRYSCSGGVTAYIRGSSTKLWGQLNVISQGGCYVDTTAPFRPQTELDLLIGALGIQLRVQGRVISYDRQAGMGVMFTRMSKTDSEQLQRLLALAASPGFP